MKKSILLFVMLCIGAIGMPAALMAQNYKIENVRVDVSGENALQAREKGLNNARRDAFNVLLAQILPSEKRFDVAMVDDQTIASMVNSFSINREKTSKDRYLANVNVSFSENAVQGYLQRMVGNSLVGASEFDNVLNMGSDIYNNAENRTSQLNKNIYNVENAYDIKVSVANLSEWVQLRNNIKLMPSVRKIAVKKIHSRYIVISVYSNKTIQLLQNDFNATGFRLYSNQSSIPDDAPYVLIGQG